MGLDYRWAPYPVFFQRLWQTGHTGVTMTGSAKTLLHAGRTEEIVSRGTSGGR